MNLTRTDTVKPSDERPARMDGKCFYCSQLIGAQHKPDCVIVSKSVTVRLVLDLVIVVPRHWDKDDIEFARNDGSWCKNNLLRDLGDWVDRTDKDEGARCACEGGRIEFLRNATEADHAEFPVITDAEPKE